MGTSAADITAWVSAGTSVVSIALATAAFRKSGPRISVAPSPYGFMGTNRPVTGGSLTLFVNVTNRGSAAVRVAKVDLELLMPRERLAAYRQTPDGLVFIDLEKPWNPASDIWASGGPAPYAPRGRLRPTRVLFRRSSSWLKFGTALTPPAKAKTTIAPFDALSFDAPLPWALAEPAEWLRIKATLATGRTVRSPWWRNNTEDMEKLKAATTDGASLAKAVGRVTRAVGGRGED